MPQITLDIPEEIYREIKNLYDGMRWSKIVRVSIVSYLEKLKKVTTSSKLLKFISPETLSIIKKIPREEAKEFYKKVREKEWKRIKSLTPPA